MSFLISQDKSNPSQMTGCQAFEETRTFFDREDKISVDVEFSADSPHAGTTARILCRRRQIPTDQLKTSR